MKTATKKTCGNKIRKTAVTARFELDASGTISTKLPARAFRDNWHHLNAIVIDQLHLLHVPVARRLELQFLSTFSCHLALKVAGCPLKNIALLLE